MSPDILLRYQGRGVLIKKSSSPPIAIGTSRPLRVDADTSRSIWLPAGVFLACSGLTWPGGRGAALFDCQRKAVETDQVEAEKAAKGLSPRGVTRKKKGE